MSSHKIAVIGISCLLPGALTYQEYWQNLIHGINSKSQATNVEMGVDPGLYLSGEKGKKDTFYCMEGGYVRDFKFDPKGYHLPEDYLESLDDMFKWPLSVSKDALKDSGYLDQPDVLNNCGIVLGNLSFPTRSSNMLCLPLYQDIIENGIRKSTGNEQADLPAFTTLNDTSYDNLKISGYPASVISNALNLKGNGVALDAACSSSIYAVKFACDYLNSGKSDLMLAGAVSCADPFFINMGFSIFQAYPEKPESSPLDKSSGGLIAGEGAGIFVLKRLDDAIRDKDHIYATICGVGLSNDGRGQSVLSPSTEGQYLAYDRAYKASCIDPGNISFVECHATGTPLGDKVEIDSMDTFFGEYGASPLIGSSKSNIGHLLTAAGMSGMIKTILSMKEKVIPGTIGIQNPIKSKNNIISGSQIPQKTISWPDPDIDGSRYAAVSGFGFGGTNGHIIFEHRKEYKINDNRETGKSVSETPNVIPLFMQKENPKVNRESKLAIIGMDALFGSSDGIPELHRTIYEGLQLFTDLPETRWKGIEKHTRILEKHGLNAGKPPRGAYIEKFDVDFLGFRIPPNKDDRLIPQQLLALKVADNALRDAGIQEGSNTAVLAAMGSELSLHQFRGRVNMKTQLEQVFHDHDSDVSLHDRTKLIEDIKTDIHGAAQVNQYTSFIGNIMASRISSLWDFSGPSFTVSSEENSVFKAMELAQLMLSSEEVDTVVITAVDLSAGFETILLNQNDLNTGPETLSFDTHVNGWMAGEGAGAVVLKRKDKALQEKKKIYANLDAMSFSSGTSGTTISENCLKATTKAGISLSDVGYLEVFASGIKEQDDAEIDGLLTAYSQVSETSNCAIGSIKSNIGHTFASSGMASLLKTCLCLYNRFLPATPGWSSPKYPDRWADSPFFVPKDSRTWFKDGNQDIRIAAINGLGHDNTCAHLILTDEPGQAGRNNEYLTRMPLSMFPLSADTPEEILSELSELAVSLQQEKILSKVASRFYRKFQTSGPKKYRVSIIGQNKREVYDDIEKAKSKIPHCIEHNTCWQSVGGSYFTPCPLSQSGKIAFVYPGGYNSYVGFGKNIFQLFPEAYDTAGHYTSRIGALSGQNLIHPKQMNHFKGDDLLKRTQDLFNTPVAMFESGIMSAVLYTDIFRDSFDIHPHHALGYSMGEVSMLFALGVWNNMDDMQDKIMSSRFFKSRLSGSMDPVIKAWNLSDHEADSKKLWYSYKLSASPSDVRNVLSGDRDISKGKSAYLIFINTQNEVIIGGHDQACRRVIKQLGCSYSEVPVSDIMHSELLKPDYEELINLHRHPVNNVENIDFYSGFNFAPLVMDSDVIAENIANIYTSEIDFQKLIETSYADGARIFIELGPRNNCRKWIDEILNNKDHISVSVNSRDTDENLTIMQALSKLFCHEVAMDLSPLFINEKMEKVTKRLLVKSITPGGTDMTKSLFTDAHSKNLKKLLTKQKKQNTPYQQIPKTNVSGTHHDTIQLNDSDPKDTVSESLSTSLFDHNITLLNKAHHSFLKNRIQGSQKLTDLITQQILSANASSDHQIKKTETDTNIQSSDKQIDLRKPASSHTTKDNNTIWDQDDLLEFAEGSISNVFGPEYEVIDTYPRRVRLPMEDYLLVTRVTELDAIRGEFKPSKMTTEYDIPFQSPLTIDGQIPWAVSVESGQCDLLLISYLGIDFQCRGERVYRLLDCTLTFVDDIAMEGDTLRYEISINSFARSGESLLFFFSYRCFVKETLVLKMDGGCAGFFTDNELDEGKGIIKNEEEHTPVNSRMIKPFYPLLTCEKQTFDRSDLLHIVHGNRAACFSKEYDLNGNNPSLRFASEKMLMIDQVDSIDVQGGAWGLGSVTGIKFLEPDHWYFPCHFKDDQVMAGSLMAEGCGQLLQFFLLYIGMHTRVSDARFQPIKNLPQKVRCRGQVIPQTGKLTYKLEVKEIGLKPNPYAIADIDILLDNRIVVDFKDLGVQMVEKKSGDPYLSQPGNPDNQTTEVTDELQADHSPLYSQYHLQHFAKGTLSECFGPSFSIYDNRTAPRTPNGDLQLTTRVIDVQGTPGVFTETAYAIAEYDVPEDVWYYRNKSHPSVMPYSIIMEIALQPCGFISACMETTLLYPDTDFYFRNLDGTGILHRDLDLRGKTIRNKAILLTTAAMGNTIIQTFTFHMTVDGQDYYSGTAAFGYFISAALTDQVGLDGGINNHPLTEKTYLSGNDIVRFNLKSDPSGHNFYQAGQGKPFYKLNGSQLDFLSDVRIVKNGGQFDLGYIYAERPISRSDWFFDCHFFQDPVMPGSLGVESVMQALEVFALHENLGHHFSSPMFTQAETEAVWKYRGQINPDIDSMAIEVHIADIQSVQGQVTVTAQASLWKDKIRIYEIKTISLVIREAIS